MRIPPFALLLFLSTFSMACSSNSPPGPIVVHVFRDRQAVDIDTAILAAGQGQLRTPRGRSIIIATLEPRSYTEGLKSLGAQTKCELVIFNAAEDGESARIEVPQQSPLVVGAKRYYLVIPGWAVGEEKEAAQLVMIKLREELAKNFSKAPPQ